MRDILEFIQSMYARFQMFEHFNFNLSRGNNKTLKDKTFLDEKVYYYKLD